MKHRNVKKKYQLFDLQLFAGDDESGSTGENPGKEEGQDSDQGEDGDDDHEGEKKFTQKDIEDAVKKRLARERRKWQREQQKDPDENTDGGGTAGNDSKEDMEKQALREKAQKAEDLELKWTCLEHDVDRDCVDDVLALARVHMAKDKDKDIEDAIDEVVKKYPQFKISSGVEEEEQKGKSWGQRQTGRTKNMSGVESRFYELNPDLKK